jgi:hypothetical protein
MPWTSTFSSYVTIGANKSVEPCQEHLIQIVIILKSNRKITRLCILTEPSIPSGLVKVLNLMKLSVKECLIGAMHRKSKMLESYTLIAIYPAVPLHWGC